MTLMALVYTSKSPVVVGLPELSLIRTNRHCQKCDRQKPVVQQRNVVRRSEQRE